VKSKDESLKSPELSGCPNKDSDVGSADCYHTGGTRITEQALKLGKIFEYGHLCCIIDFTMYLRLNTYCVRGRAFDPRTVQTFVCMNMSVCTGAGCFLCLLCLMCMYLQKKLSIYLSGI
jgi:hypothetical protein